MHGLLPIAITLIVIAALASLARMLLHTRNDHHGWIRPQGRHRKANAPAQQNFWPRLWIHDAPETPFTVDEAHRQKAVSPRMLHRAMPTEIRSLQHLNRHRSRQTRLIPPTPRISRTREGLSRTEIPLFGEELKPTDCWKEASMPMSTDTPIQHVDDTTNLTAGSSDRHRRLDDMRHPIVFLDTDIGYDADDIVALVVAARRVENLVVITADETNCRRAKLARTVLDALDRNDVPVYAGIELGGDRFLLDDHITGVPDQSAAFVTATTRIVSATTGPIRWIGLGPLTNLAHLLSVVPDLADRLAVTQMGGWLDHYRHPDRASHNFHTDPRSAGLALRLLNRPRLVLSDHTAHPALHVTADDDLYRRLATTNAPSWARLVTANFDAWFTRRGGSWMHDPLTVSAALGLPFTDFHLERVQIERDARLRRDPAGHELVVSTAVDYAGFWNWLLHVVAP
ncbi:nucleoside hydrolase [Nocardia arthritidis]|uniref:Inosine/uridine-preferring nucleoside hydrolase domain-containing protein n=1 Tax=Nocardia arthritidis TaxID=228602 RepID=A0A6G9Y6W6_9NOCA|nr:nucleoside hydrolase [Nocardia arthritidis]QIS08816.1 hypothetical protein F5544_04510 [Nocardia arthritidis]